MLTKFLILFILSLTILQSNEYKDEKIILRIDNIEKNSKEEQLFNSIKYDNLIIKNIVFHKNFAIASAEDNSPLARRMIMNSEYKRLIILRTINHGESWEKVYTSEGETISDILVVDEKTAIIVHGEEGEGETVLVLNDSGDIWNKEHYIDSYKKGEYFNKILKYKNQILIVVQLSETEDKFIILKNDKRGGNWKKIPDDVSSKILKDIKAN